METDNHTRDPNEECGIDHSEVEVTFEDGTHKGTLKFPHPEFPEEILEVDITPNARYLKVLDILKHPEQNPLSLTDLSEQFQTNANSTHPKSSQLSQALQSLDKKTQQKGIYVHRKKIDGERYAFISSEKPQPAPRSNRRHEVKWESFEDDQLKSRIKELISEEGGASQETLLALFPDQSRLRQKIKLNGKIQQVTDDFESQNTGITIIQEEVELNDGKKEKYYSLGIIDDTSK